MRKKERTIQYVDLPYNFISLPEEYRYPYTKKRDGDKREVLPKHSNKEGISGYIEYKLIPRTDLAVEVREIEEENKFFLSGSVMRGRVRTNLEILSKSYPQFVNCTPMLFRDFTWNLKESYRDELGIEEGIEKSIRVGFLRKDNNIKFFVVPAKKFSDNKFFISIKEHELIKRFSVNLDEENRLFRISDKKWFDKISEIQNRANEITDEIKKLREEYKDQISCYNKSISTIFTEEFTFTKRLKPLRKIISNEIIENFFSNKFWDKLENIKEELYSRLKELPVKNNNIDKFFELMSERWMLKAVIDLLYYYLTKENSNKKYKPYQKLFFYEKDINGGIKNISSSASEKKKELLKGYLYNSTNAGTKRSHYFVNEPEEDKDVFFEVPEDVIESYKQNYKKMHFTKGEKSLNKEKANFYNVFDNKNYEKLIEEYPEGLIVFFQLENNEDKTSKRVKRIGRTPYFKIRYKHSLRDIIGEKEKNRVDYAEALFGYVTEKTDTFGQNRDEEYIYLSYKSRLRFSAIDIELNKPKQEEQLYLEKLLKPREFLLHSPSATACGMYLKQVDGAKLITYQDNEPKLRGYKYYHIWDEIDKLGIENNTNIRGVITKESISQMKGRIHFYNLKPQELGLLLISLDIKELLHSKKYCNDLKDFCNYIESCHELIGGAKPYGYGNVKVEVEDIYIEKEDDSFESLILGPLKEEKENKSQYIDKYLEEAYKAGKKCVLCRLKEYVNSKQERVRDNKEDGDFTKQRPKRISWANLSEKVYPKEWRLID
ncbi:hypothetical protein [Acetivibrio straminisolvens]|uniref:hypothetical protein n=1 Tax=Acetivibrio straminisolvens TaxID=253314 RepID=UPI00223F73CF|nr:hypothetical protein [Acetivibrio straminisolvens]